MTLGIGFIIVIAAAVLVLSLPNLLQLSPLMLFVAVYGLLMIIAVVVMLVMGIKHKRKE